MSASLQLQPGFAPTSENSKAYAPDAMPPEFAEVSGKPGVIASPAINRPPSQRTSTWDWIAQTDSFEHFMSRVAGELTPCVTLNKADVRELIDRLVGHRAASTIPSMFSVSGGFCHEDRHHSDDARNGAVLFVSHRSRQAERTMNWRGAGSDVCVVLIAERRSHAASSCESQPRWSASGRCR